AVHGHSSVAAPGRPTARNAGAPAGDGEGARDAAARGRVDAFGDPLPPRALARLGTVRFRHHAPIHCLALSPDGSTVATAGGDPEDGGGQAIRLWDRATGREVGQLLGQIDSPAVIAFSPDGRTLASVGGLQRWDHEHTVRVWDVAARRQLHVL